MSGLSRARHWALCVFACRAAIFAQAVPWIRRESADARSGALSSAGAAAAEDLAVHGGSLLETEMSPGIDSMLEHTESGKTTEAERVWLQFKALDGRFAEAARKYMRAIGAGQEKDAHETRVEGVLSIMEQDPKLQAEDTRAGIQVGQSSHDALPYGFYVHAFFEAAAIVNQLRSIRKFYPEAPVYVMSDGGANFSGICESIGNCKFAWKAPAHDCWNPKPFLDRLREGALWLQSQNAEFTIFLEPDVTLHKRASRPLREGVAAGGLRDEWNPTLPIKIRELAQDLGRKFSGNTNFTITWDRFGLAGGSIIRTRAAIMAFRPDYINWLEFEKLYNKEVYSSDIAMLIALAAHGFDYYPWPEVSQPSNKAQYDHDTAFHHHSSGEKGGKPFYGKELAKEDKHLVSPPPHSMQPLKNSQCQHCVWVDEVECWPKHLNGKSDLQHIECPAVDEDTFRRRAWTFKEEVPKPHLFKDS